jgi:hypothetical protein
MFQLFEGIALTVLGHFRSIPIGRRCQCVARMTDEVGDTREFWRALHCIETRKIEEASKVTR